MGLKSLAAIKPDEQIADLVIELKDFGAEGSIRFRSPKAADHFPDFNEIKMAKMHFPEFKDAMCETVLIMGRTYVPDEEDTGQAVQAWKVIGGIARTNKLLFLHIISEWGRAFPMASLPERKEVGNDSAE